MRRTLLAVSLLFGFGVLAQPKPPTPTTTTGSFSCCVNTPTVTSKFIDAGTVNVSAAGVECAIGITSTNNSTFRALCLDKAGGLSASGPYIGQAGNNVTLASTGNVDINSGSGNTVRLNSGTGGAIRIDGSQSSGSCALVSGTPSTCTATVRASSVCVCTPVGTTSTIAAAGCAVSLSSSTLTITGPNSVTTTINYHCF